MYQDEDILAKLGASDAPDDEKALLLEQVRTLVGEAISDTLSEQQLTEYQAIIDDDTSVINAWLEQNIPEYKTHPLYEEFAEANKGDAEKLFASVAWIEVNVPTRQEIIETVIENFDKAAL